MSAETSTRSPRCSSGTNRIMQGRRGRIRPSLCTKVWAVLWPPNSNKVLRRQSCARFELEKGQFAMDDADDSKHIKYFGNFSTGLTRFVGSHFRALRSRYWSGRDCSTSRSYVLLIHATTMRDDSLTTSGSEDWIPVGK